MTTSKYPILIKAALSVKIAHKIEALALKRKISLSKAIRGIIEKYFELNP